MKLCTKSDSARAQHRAALALAQDFEPIARAGGLPRVLLTGFSRFRQHETNASGLLMSELLPGLSYPQRAGSAVVRSPAAEMAVGCGTVELPTVGEVELCAMILPVYWDLAAALLIRQLAAFEPQLVLMNGIAAARQPLWIEVEARNYARREVDASGVLQVSQDAGWLIEKQASPRTPLLMSWSSVQQAAREAIQEFGEGDRALTETMPDAILAPADREDNSYVCNNTAYTVSFAMDHPGRRLRLLEASDALADAAGGMLLALDHDSRQVPRGFLHWPSAIIPSQIAAAGTVLRRVVDAQLAALSDPARQPERAPP